MELVITEKPTICLNMIVKDEHHIIVKTLEMLCSKIAFSYWVICETGSTDNTKELIVELPTLIDELTLVRLTIPLVVTALELATKLVPTVKLAALTPEIVIND